MNFIIKTRSDATIIFIDSILLRILHKVIDDCTAQAFLKRNRSGKAYLCFVAQKYINAELCFVFIIYNS